jgi:predicted ATPase
MASGGNPFFALEMSRSLIRRGMPASTEALPVPATIGELVRDRLEPLSARAREALLVVSAAPRVPAALVAAAAGGDGQIIEGLSEAEDAGILVQVGGGLEFTHPLLASVVYSQVPPARRRRLHRSIAAALAGSAATGGFDAKACAWHLGLGAEGHHCGWAGPARNWRASACVPPHPWT